MDRLGLGIVAAALLGCAALTTFAVAQEKSEIPPLATLPDGSKSQEGAKNEDGKWVLPDGSPTYNVKADGKLDWYSYSGFRRYHDVGGCQQCHGPEGKGSSYAPALVDSLKKMTYNDFLAVVASGRVNGNSVMPALGDNKSIMCYIEDIYAYLKSRSDESWPGGRPTGREEKPEAAKTFEKECIG